MSELLDCGKSDKVKLLFESFLQNGYQRFPIINSYLNSNTVSKWTQIKYGVRQGSILGPLLFLVHIDDLPKATKHKVIPILFADETSILITSPNNIQFQSDLNVAFRQLNKWFKGSNRVYFSSMKSYGTQQT
jgi:hypothetical protein